MTWGPDDEIVKRGTWLYAGTVPVEVRITRGDVFYGTGDYEDPPEIYDDRNVETFSVWFESTTEPGTFNASGGQFMSLEEAIARTERTLRTAVKWQ